MSMDVELLGNFDSNISRQKYILNVYKLKKPLKLEAIKDIILLYEVLMSMQEMWVQSGSERSPGEGNGNPLQYSCLGNSAVRGAWWATVCGVAKSQIRLRHN